MAIERISGSNRPIAAFSGETCADLPAIPSFDYLVNFAFYSFEHSQGRPAMQKYIYQFTRAIRPDWNITADMTMALPDALIARITPFINHSNEKYDKDPNNFRGEKIVHEYIEPPRRHQEMMLRLADFKNAFASSPEDITETLQKITVHMFRTEAEILYDNKGRPRHGIKNSSLVSDRWFSYLVHYALLGNSTGIAEFDEMYKGIKDGIYNKGFLQGLNRETDAAVDVVINIWNKEHPNQPFTW